MADTVRKVDSERLTQILPDALRAIHEVIESHKVTEEEWMAVLDFLTEVGKQDEFILLSDVTKTSVLVDAISHQDESGVTPSDVEGPLYREDPPWREKPVKIYYVENPSEAKIWHISVGTTDEGVGEGPRDFS